MKAYVKGYQSKRLIIESENKVEENFLKSWGKKQPIIVERTGPETIGGKPTYRSTLGIRFIEGSK